MIIHFGDRPAFQIGARPSFGAGTSLAALIRALFRNGEDGTWLDPSDASTLFQDAAGTTPAGIGDPVRLIRDKSGNDHDALAPSDAARPVVGRVPATGRRNLLTYTEELDNAAWNEVGTITVTNLGEGVFRINNFDDVAGDRFSSPNASFPPLSTVTGAFEVRGEGSDIGKFIRITPKRSGGGSFTGISIPIQLTGDWQRVPGTFTLGSDNTGAQVTLGWNAVDGTPAEAPLARFPQLETGSTATPYQRVGSQFDVTEAGVPSAIYLRRNLIDNQLDVTLPAITNGKIIIGTTEGVWVDDLDFAGGTFSLGPTTYTGGPAGLYDAIGADELGTIILDRQPTAAELANIMKWFKSKGAPGNLITEPF